MSAALFFAAIASRISRLRSPSGIPALLLTCAFCVMAFPLLSYASDRSDSHAPSPAAADAEPFWHRTMRLHAAEDGYRLLSPDKLATIPDTALLLDVRPDYEYQSGHIADAVNLEFDPGDADNLSPEKAAQLKEILGLDTKRMIVVYCRSFRCLRSGIAAKAAARLGYTNVWRMAEGYFGWLDVQEPQKGEAPGRCGSDAQTAVRRLPDHGLAILGGDADRRILGLPENAHTARLEDIRCDMLVVLFFNTHCIQCREQMIALEKLTRRINDAAGKARSTAPALLVGIGVQESKRTLATMRHGQEHPIPLFADPDAALFAASGFAGVPAAWLIGPTDASQREILMSATGEVAGNPDFRSLLFRMTGVPAWGIDDTATTTTDGATHAAHPARQ
ncbi:rhodanese-like domain-containing protein [Oleidesulfovibrio sp.]|uniref:rhodanese-like domain-containing protein n=1 Tax=Oleidesulfovibrio sp. TaxID=2909707 RepID=UPI003A8708A6